MSPSNDLLLGGMSDEDAEDSIEKEIRRGVKNIHTNPTLAMELWVKAQLKIEDDPVRECFFINVGRMIFPITYEQFLEETEIMLKGSVDLKDAGKVEIKSIGDKPRLPVKPKFKNESIKIDRASRLESLYKIMQKSLEENE